MSSGAVIDHPWLLYDRLVVGCFCGLETSNGVMYTIVDKWRQLCECVEKCLEEEVNLEVRSGTECCFGDCISISGQGEPVWSREQVESLLLSQASHLHIVYSLHVRPKAGGTHDIPFEF